MKSPLGVLVFLVLAGACSSGPKTGGNRELQCEVGIVGGGPAGIYMAYRLASQYGERICLFEKESELGGRLRDEKTSDGPEGVWVGTGGRRVNSTQNFVLGLARELGVELQTPEKRSQLILHRGRYGYSPDDFVSLYPRLPKSKDLPAGTTRDDQIYSLLLAKENVAKAKLFPNVRSYITAIAGPDAVSFLRGSSRFHADFDYDLSAPNYLEYLEHENALSAVNSYPVGGMSAFIRKMEAAALKHHVRIFKSEPVLEMKRATDHAGYVLRTPKHEATVHRLVVAVPPVGFDHIQGALAAEVRKAPEYKALVPIRIVVINQVWDQKWWADVRNPSGKGNTAKTWRAWTTDQCVNHVELPQESYLADAKVTRSVYSDDPKCSKYWEDLLAQGGIGKVEAEVVKGLKRLFDHGLDKTRVKVPKPLRTTMHVWPGGWYYIHAGATVSNKEIAKWSIQPLMDQPNFMLVGEAYWPDRPGWSEGAYFSVHQLLDARFK